MSRWWESVPQVSWTGTHVETPPESKVTEPSVVANVAASTEIHSELEDSAGTSTVTNAIPWEADAPGLGVSDEPSAVSAAATAGDASVIELDARGAPANSPPQIPSLPKHVDRQVEQGEGEDNIERLKAALTEDAARGREHSEPAGGAHDVRVRVESLLERSRRLFDVGRLREARQTAQVARDLGDTARIDYSPDEERPIDLVNQIDNQLHASADDGSARSDAGSVKSADKKNGAESPDATPARSPDAIQPAASPNDIRSASPPNDEESPGRFRLRRDWNHGMGVFRRDRKTTPAPERRDERLPEVSETFRVQIGFDSTIDGKEDTAHAAVQANRGITFVNHESPRVEEADADRSRATSSAVRRSASSGGESPGSRRPAVSSVSDVEDWPTGGGSNGPGQFPVPGEISGADDGRRLEIEDLPPVPPVFEDVRPLSPFHEVQPGVIPDRVVSERDDGIGYSIWGWCAGAVGFAICGLLALTCYRRGAV